MARLIRLHDVDQFSEVVRIPEASVTDEVLQGVRNLHETRELEPALLEILFDPIETPHGPTEIADIVTSRVIVRGARRLACFVLKGRSFPRVTSRHVAHQFIRLRTIPDLGLMVFMAVGDIHDDAQRDFVQTAIDADTDYLIVDAVDIARLLIAYEKICPADGLRFDSQGVCGNGHSQDPGATLDVPIRGELYFEVPRIRDVSHVGAKRYAATVLVDRNASRDMIREVIRRALPIVRSSEHHRNEFVERTWSGVDAHVVFFFIASTLDNVRNANWIARAQWIDPELPEIMRPHSLNADECNDDISVLWNQHYEGIREFYRSNTAKKGPLLKIIRELVVKSERLIEQVSAALTALDNGEINRTAFESIMRDLVGPIESLGSRSGDLPFPPDDLNDLDNAAQGLFGLVGNLAIYYSDLGIKKWDSDSKIELVRMTLDDCLRDLAAVRYELRRID